MLARHKRSALGVSIALAALSVGFVAGRMRAEAPTRLTFLSVGQGDCSVFQHRGLTVLVDVGPKSEGFDAGERIVTPALRRLGVVGIDLILLSHPDADHVGGLDAVLTHFRVGRIVMPAHFRGREDMAAVLEKHGISPSDVVWSDGDEVVELGDFKLYVETPVWDGTGSDNEGSMFVKLLGDGASCVFSGDASSLTELGMLGRGPGWRAQILHAGHHGSSHSTCPQWLDAVRPTYAVLSVGRNNRYGHPSPEVVGRLEAAGVTTLRTDRLGDISFEVGPRGFVLTSGSERRPARSGS